MCGATKGGVSTAGVDVSKEAIIQGRVLRGGEPAASAYVRLLDATDEFTAEVPTSATGHFRFFAGDGTFKSDDELKELYTDAGVDWTKDTIAYCRIGERSSHTWFVLKELLGQDHVKNYDGSWTEYGSLVGVPIALGDDPGSADPGQDS